jgi:cell division protease FtsH
VTIVPRGMALGVTYQLPTDDRTNYTEEYLRARITTALGGRAAERLVYGQTSTGAENDLQQVTQLAQNMVVRWGMSRKVGALNFAFQTDQYPAGLGARPYSEATAELIGAETRRIVEQCEAVADRLLVEHRERLDALARALLEQEALDEREILEVTGLPAQEQPGHEPGLARAAAMAEMPSGSPVP